MARKLLIVAIATLSCTGLLGLARADDAADAKAALEKHNLRASGTNLFLGDEAAFIKALEKIATHRKNLTKAMKDNDQMQSVLNQYKQQVVALKQQEVQGNAQLANAKSVAENNKIVGALRALQGQTQLLLAQREELDKKDKEIRTRLTQAREDFIQFTLDERKLADSITAQYEAKKSDPELLAAVELAKKAANKEFVFGPSGAFTSAVRRLKAVEDTVLSEAIPLRAQNSTFYVSVVVDGKHKQEMVVDSGSSTLALPEKIANDMGLRVNSTDPEVVLSLADGSQIRGHKKTISSVRVGKFTVNNVDCVVFGPDAVKAEPLLGMSFLGNFKFEVNAAANTLTMVKVAGDTGK